MSVAVQIVCDGCGRVIKCGAGKTRRPVHQVRTRLRESGWVITGGAYGDFCVKCTPLRQETLGVVVGDG